MDPTAIATALGLILAGEFLVGHGLLFPLFHFGAGLQPSLAMRLAHVCGFAIGYAVAAFAVSASSGAVVCWGGAPLVPGIGVLIGGLIWLAIVVFAPPGPAGVKS